MESCESESSLIYVGILQIYPWALSEDHLFDTKLARTQKWTLLRSAKLGKLRQGGEMTSPLTLAASDAQSVSAIAVRFGNR